MVQILLSLFSLASCTFPIYSYFCIASNPPKSSNQSLCCYFYNRKIFYRYTSFPFRNLLHSQLTPLGTKKMNLFSRPLLYAKSLLCLELERRPLHLMRRLMQHEYFSSYFPFSCTVKLLLSLFCLVRHYRHG